MEQDNFGNDPALPVLEALDWSPILTADWLPLAAGVNVALLAASVGIPYLFDGE